MLKFLPAGWIGLMVGGLVAANSSTILSHLNWGASYLVHDFYRRFLRPSESENHYVLAGRMATILLFVLSSAAGVRSANRAGDVLSDPPGGRRNRIALFAALVLVAHHGLVRNCGHDRFLRDLGRVFHPGAPRRGHSGTDRELLITVLLRPSAGSSWLILGRRPTGHAGHVLPEGPARWTRLEARPD